MLRLLRYFTAVIGVMCAVPAHADVTLTFYSHELGSSFPHAFFTLKGQVDGTGEKVDTNYGFTAVHVSPGILLGSVLGKVEVSKTKYVAKSNRHFSVRLTDVEYGKVMGIVAKWRNVPGKSYNLNNRNCVHFTMETAALLGMNINRKSKFFKKPTSFMNELLALNPRFQK